ncbi:Ent-copalyl diphosphate synthase [Actinomadura sp. RB68]|uniref:Ent-copalyl diphosphate synthase n=1 Tax=Actinomadura macrotermitis TaxID=2585200 RepID=A0A7K0BXZ7_9ACTN|nr:Ent-copalyl diphosphate synthase [Actinomadura macrotermitis]
MRIGVDVAAEARALVQGLVRAPWGQVSPSVYETGRLVTLTPWLTGHDRRVAYLLRTQRPDGGWGAPEAGYALVPTLSATEALLSVLHADPGGAPAVVAAADAGLERLTGLLPGAGRSRLPDMPAIELIVPSLITLIGRHLLAPPPGLEHRRDLVLPLPAGMDNAKLAMIRAMLASGAVVPQKLLHALEIVGDTARGLPHVRPEATGTIGASPAATAAWLGDRPPADPSDPARWHLETVASWHDGPVPVGYPLTVFERGWVLAWLARAGIPFTTPPELVLSLTAPLGPAGTSAAAGLPADADTTAGALYALALLGAPHSPDALWEYETPTHFCTWAGEDGFSLTTNAHVLEAFGQYLESVGRDRLKEETARRYDATIRKVGDWLCEQQHQDGSWTDRWHASPYYATACCVFALDRFGGGAYTAAVQRARRWVLDTQHPDGSWGRWGGTAEETAYAVQILLLTSSSSGDEPVRAALRAADLLSSALTGDAADEPPALWHDKDLYHPTAIVRAAVLVSAHLLQSATGIAIK